MPTTPHQAVLFLRHAHYRLMESTRFWYDKADIMASSILCRNASDINSTI